jgi:hypothetical protein
MYVLYPCLVYHRSANCITRWRRMGKPYSKQSFSMVCSRSRLRPGWPCSAGLRSIYIQQWRDSTVTGPWFHWRDENIILGISNGIMYNFRFFVHTSPDVWPNSLVAVTIPCFCDYLSPIFFKFHGRVFLIVLWFFAAYTIMNDKKLIQLMQTYPAYYIRLLLYSENCLKRTLNKTEIYPLRNFSMVPARFYSFM